MTKISYSLLCPNCGTPMKLKSGQNNPIPSGSHQSTAYVSTNSTGINKTYPQHWLEYYCTNCDFDCIGPYEFNNTND